MKYVKYYIIYLICILELMSCMLSLDPNKRCRCSEALKMPYFRNRPAPTPGPNLPMPNSLSSKDSDLNDFEVYIFWTYSCYPNSQWPGSQLIPHDTLKLRPGAKFLHHKPILLRDSPYIDNSGSLQFHRFLSRP